MGVLSLPFVPVLIRTLQLFGSTVLTDHPDRPNTIQLIQSTEAADRVEPKDPAGETRTRPDAAAGAARCLEAATRGRGASKRLVSVRPVAAGASLAHRGLTSTRVAPGTLASSPQVRVRTRTLPAKKRATQVHREPYDESSVWMDGVCVRLSARPYTESGVVYGRGRGAGRRTVARTTAAQVPSTYDHPNQQGHCLRSTPLYRLGHT